MRSAPVAVPTRDDMHAFGRALASVLRAGDVVVLSGPLGAGKTTLTQGIASGLDVRGEITSPTFVIARVHPPNDPAAGVALVHADAYRLGSRLELDDLDLDASLDDAITVVEWGEGLVEGLSENRLVVDIARSRDDESEERAVTVHGVGPRWDGVTVPGAGSTD